MSGGGGGPIIIRKFRAAAELETVQEQLGPIRRSKLLAILAKDDEDWTHLEARFVWRCVMDAYEAFE